MEVKRSRILSSEQIEESVWLLLGIHNYPGLSERSRIKNAITESQWASRRIMREGGYITERDIHNTRVHIGYKYPASRALMILDLVHQNNLNIQMN